MTSGNIRNRLKSVSFQRFSHCLCFAIRDLSNSSQRLCRITSFPGKRFMGDDGDAYFTRRKCSPIPSNFRIENTWSLIAMCCGNELPRGRVRSSVNAGRAMSLENSR